MSTEVPLYTAVRAYFAAGMSEALHNVDLDARLWVESPESPECHIHQIIAIKIHPNQPEIVFRMLERSRRE